MSQAGFLRDIDEQLMGAFHAAGLADDAEYTAPTGGAAVPCRVYVDRDPAMLAMNGVEVAGNRVMVGFLRAEIDRPDIGGVVVIDGESFVLEARIRHDESMARFVVAPL